LTLSKEVNLIYNAHNVGEKLAKSEAVYIYHTLLTTFIDLFYLHCCTCFSVLTSHSS